MCAESHLEFTMSKVIEKDRRFHKPTTDEPKAKKKSNKPEKPLGVLEALEARVAELEARLVKVHSDNEGLYFVEICGKLVCMRGDTPVLIADKDDREIVTILCELSDPKTISACKQGKEFLENLRANSVKR
jgi:hypothetical protein